MAFFDRRARSYDLQLPLEGRALRAAASLAEPLGGARIVDLAAGTGAFAAAILNRSPSLRSLTLVDASPRMLERARHRLSRAGAEPLFIVADVRRVPLADRCADVVAVGYLLHLLDFESRRHVLDEARRLLEPGGRLVAVVHGSPRGVAGGIYRGAWTAMSRVIPTAVIGNGPMTDLAAAVAAAGFEVDGSRRVPGVYWSEVLRARRPGDRAQR